VTIAGDEATALKHVEDSGSDLHLVVLDLMLPGMSGYAVCEAIRAQGNDIPVLILSARTLTEDRTRGFDVGADQYLNKPFELDELLSRVNNLLKLYDRRASRPVEDTVETFAFADASINFETYEVLIAGEPVKLTELEMKLLRYFIENEGRVVRRDELLENVWEMPASIETRAVDQFIRRLRKTFEPEPSKPQHFLTIRDAGYRFVAKPGDNGVREAAS